MQESQKKTILVDLRPLLGGRISGVENYILNLLPKLFACHPDFEFLLWVNSFGDFEFPEALRAKNVRTIKTKIPNKILNLSFSYLGFPKLEKLIKTEIDLVFLPDPRPVATKKPLVTMFHDLSFERFPNFFNRKTKVWHKILRPKYLAKKSQTLLCPSLASANDLKKIYGIASQKITITPEAPVLTPNNFSLAQENKILAEYGLDNSEYIFTLSTLEPRKNLARLVEAYELARLPQKLVIAGISNPKIFAEMPRLEKNPNVVLTGFLTEEKKEILMKRAKFFVNVSLLEGFGLPVCEAVSLGTACLVSDNSSLGEVAGGAGFGVDPTRVSSILAGLKKLSRDEKLLAKMRKACPKQAGKFSWQKCAEKTCRVFEKILKNKKSLTK